MIRDTVGTAADADVNVALYDVASGLAHAAARGGRELAMSVDGKFRPDAFRGSWPARGDQGAT